MRIAIDLDNTIVDYEALFLAVAASRGVTDPHVTSKATLRTALRALPDGEREWMAVQAVVYGSRMREARPFAGCLDALRAARARGDELFIVSHKTAVAAAAPDGPNLHDAARAWLSANGVVPELIAAEHAFFALTRDAKLERIAALAVDLAIDDLPEVLGDPAFPHGVERWLFAPAGAAPGPWRAFASWHAIDAALAGA